MNRFVAFLAQQKVSLDLKVMMIKQGYVNMLTVVDFWVSLFAKIGFTV